MKKILKKTSIILGSILGLLIIAIIVIPLFFKGNLIDLAKKEIQNNVNAEVDLKDFGLNLFSNFPNLQFSLNDFSVIGKDEFKGDTLAYIKKFSVTLDLFSVIKGDKINIVGFEIDDPVIKGIVKSDGKANWNITIPSEEKVEEVKDTSKSNFNIALKRYEINNANILFRNDSTNMYAEIKNLTHKGSGNFNQDLFLLETKTIADEITVSNKGVKYLNKTKFDVKIDLEMDSKNSKYTFKENYVKINDFMFSFDGFVKIVDSNNMDLDIAFKSNQSDFKSILSLVPSIFKKDFKNITTSGSLAFNGYVKGGYSKEKYPAFNLNLSVNNGMFKYPDLPDAAENINIDLNVNKESGPLDLIVIDLKKFHLEFSKNPFDMTLNLRTPISDPAVKMNASGKVDLANMQKIVPMENIKKLAGLLNLNINVSGKMSDFKAQKVDNISASGTLDITGLEYADNENMEANISKMLLEMNPKNVELKTLDTRLGKSDVHADGYLKNLLPFVLAKNEVLEGQLNINSKYIDLDDLMKSESSKTVSTEKSGMPSELAVIEIPDNIIFTLNTKVDKLNFDNLEYSSISGTLNIKNKTVNLGGSGSDKYFRLNALDGSIGLNGLYDTRDIKKPKIDFGLDVKDLDVKKSAEHFVTIQNFAPVAKESEGKFSALFKLNSQLKQNMMPDYETINANGKLSLKDVVVKNFGVLTKIAEKLKIDKFKQLSVSNASIDFEIIQGRIYIKPFTISPFDSKMTISGSNGLDQTIDYLVKFEIPRSQFGADADNIINGLTNKINKIGFNVKPQDKVSIVFAVTGTFNDPGVKPVISGSDIVDDIKDQVKDKVNQELEKKKQEIELKKQELENKAKEELDKKKQELEVKQKEIEQKAKEEADKKKKEAEEKLKKETKEKLKKLF
jgi:hypothetical protein